MEEQLLDLSDLRVDGDTQPRTAIDTTVVVEYAEAIEGGAEFPPVEVVCDGAVHWLVDGFHRFYAHRKLGRKQIMAIVATGMLEDARWRSLGANKTHGLRRTNADKAKAVRRALKLKPDSSDRDIAQHIGVHYNTVARYRQALCRGSTITNSDSRTGRDGRTRNTSRIGRTPASRPKRGGISPKAFRPVQTGNKPLPMTALSMPRDPDMGARTLIELFDADYLRALTDFLTTHLKGVHS